MFACIVPNVVTKEVLPNGSAEIRFHALYANVRITTTFIHTRTHTSHNCLIWFELSLQMKEERKLGCIKQNTSYPQLHRQSMRRGNETGMKRTDSCTTEEKKENKKLSIVSRRDVFRRYVQLPLDTSKLTCCRTQSLYCSRLLSVPAKASCRVTNDLSRLCFALPIICQIISLYIIRLKLCGYFPHPTFRDYALN